MFQIIVKNLQDLSFLLLRITWSLLIVYWDKIVGRLDFVPWRLDN